MEVETDISVVLVSAGAVNEFDVPFVVPTGATGGVLGVGSLDFEPNPQLLRSVVIRSIQRRYFIYMEDRRWMNYI